MSHFSRTALCLAVAAFLVIGCLDYASPSEVGGRESFQTPNADSTRVLNAIERAADSIDARLASYEQVDADLEESTQRGIAKGFFKEGRFGKIESRHYGEMGRRHAHYFFDESSLVLVADTTFYYDKPLSLGNVSVDSTTVAQLFFQNESLFSLQTSSRAMPDGKLEQQALSETERLKALLKQARP